MSTLAVRVAIFNSTFDSNEYGTDRKRKTWEIPVIRDFSKVSDIRVSKARIFERITSKLL